MPPLPVIDDCYRITINYASFLGVTPRNVIHILAPTGTGDDVADAMDGIPDLALANPMPADFTPNNCDILPLDGTTATRNKPMSGWECNSDAPFVPEAAAVVSLRTDVRGPRGRGRVFIGPCGEGDVQDGFIETATVTDMGAAWESFATYLDGLGMGLVVASYVHAEANAVTNLNVVADQATQRRRLLQLRV